MEGIQKMYVNFGIQTVINAWKHLMGVSAEEALSEVRYGKTDTLGMDAFPEIRIKECIANFSSEAILVTEETDEISAGCWSENPDKFLQPLIFFSDPLDRSKFLKRFLEKKTIDLFTKVGDIVSEQEATKYWESAEEETPMMITGATSSLTCVSKGQTVFSVIVNVITQTIFVACPAGIFYLKLPPYNDVRSLEKIDLDYVMRKGKEVKFVSAKKVCKTSDDFQRFVTFLGKTGYRENFDDSMIFLGDQADKHLCHSEPGGPSRILYLSEFQNSCGPIGFILANGEKIGEWIHWLPFVKYAKNSDGEKALKIFEIYTKRGWNKEGILMSPPPPYSIFRHKKGEDHYLNISRLRGLDRPSHFRSMIVVTPYDNEIMISIMRKHNYHEVSGSF